MAIAFPHTLQDYRNEVLADALAIIDDGAYDSYDDFDDAYDAMWDDDAVTGNGSGSYYFSAYDAAKAVSGLIWDPDAIQGLVDEMGVDASNILERGPEDLDVVFRCAALGQVYGYAKEAWNTRREGGDN